MSRSPGVGGLWWRLAITLTRANSGVRVTPLFDGCRWQWRVWPRGVGVHAAAVGGPWEWRMRPSGAVAVVVPLGWQVIFQPQR